jgi:hypothetical protein
MTHRRERDIRRMVADLGLEITSFRQDGGSHWRVDVKAPNGRQRPFTFPTRDSGNWHSERNELAMLRRWRREVMPELDAAEEAGELEVPASMKTTLAQRLEGLGIPLRKEPDPQFASQVIRPLTSLRDRPVQTPPFEKRKVETSTPEAALATSLKSPAHKAAPTPPPTQSIPPQETSIMSAPSEQINVPNHRKGANPTAKYTKNVLTQGQFYQLCKWVEVPSQLDGCWSYKDAAKKATQSLGYMVADNSIKRALEATGTKMPENAANSKRTRDRLTIVAEGLVTLMRSLGHEPDHELLVAAKMLGKE